MGKEKENEKEVSADQKKIKTQKASVDFPVKVIATEADPYHETGEEFEAGEKKAKELVKRGWVKMASILLFALCSFGAIAQSSLYQVLGTNLALDTVVNAATVTLTSKVLSQKPYANVLVWVNVTKISGTVGGTLTLQGSIDGTNFKALNTVDTQTALATITATDATNTYHWRLGSSAFTYYRVSWTGAGTMSASFSAKVYRN
jgi:hypothetical protein